MCSRQQARVALRCLLCLGAILSVGFTHAARQRPPEPIVRNGSFEADGANIKNVGYIVYGNPLSGWVAGNVLGVGRNTQEGPFIDNGVVPDGRNVCVLQNLSAVSQTVGSLAAGRTYRFSMRANGRGTDAPDFGGLRVELNGSILVDTPHVTAVGGRNPYHTLRAYFSGGSGTALLSIAQTNPRAGVSVMVDDVRIEEAEPPHAEEVLQINPASVLSGPTLPPESDLTDVPWIWTNETRRSAKAGTWPILAPPGMRMFRRTFTLAAKPDRAVVTFTADDACGVWLNGGRVGWSAGHTQLRFADVTHLAKAGANTLAVEATNGGDEPNPAGLILKLVASFRSGQPGIVLTTDGRWRAGDGGARPVGEMGSPPWGWVGPRSARVSRWFPDFRVPGADGLTRSVRRLFALHADDSRPACTLWDGWLPLAGLWPVRGRHLDDRHDVEAWKQALLSRDVSDEGYVASHQHRGLGHSKGWPIPLYRQTGGVGFHFSVANDVFAQWVPRLAEAGAWDCGGMAPGALDRARGWDLTADTDDASVSSPRFSVPMAAAPFVRVEWQIVEGRAVGAYVQWATEDAPGFDARRRMEFAPVTRADGMAYSDVPICDSPSWSPGGRMVRLRFGVVGGRGARIILKSIITPADTRHNINNPCFIQGSCIYLDWTGDLDFLRRNIERMRRAMAYSIREFRLRESLCVDMRWFGHDGRSGFARKRDGTREARWAVGVGNNYWDLLPFGGKDTLATVYHYDALRRMAKLERAIAAHPEWRLPGDTAASDPAGLEDLARRIKTHAGQLLWNRATGRFVACIDRDGVAHDYGYTIANLEAIHYGFASLEQARSILDWLDGRRIVRGDTSTGRDLYRWRFGPRCSTRRNDDWYSGMWEPGNVAFGDQVQDGGGVLGFSYFDIMARLGTLGPDDAARRLGAIAEWFNEVQAEGGYRAYYAKPGRGTLQGGGPPGGLGMDVEFVESVLVPQAMLYGFLGFRPGLEGFSVRPELPARWPSLTVTLVRYRGLVMDVTATRTNVTIRVRGGRATGPVRLIGMPASWRALVLLPDGRSVPPTRSGAGWIVPAAAGARLMLTATR